jgi:hypothetical protein
VSFAEVDYQVPAAGAAELAVLLPEAGTYLISFNVQVTQVSASAETVSFRMRDQTTAATLPGSTVSDYLGVAVTDRHFSCTVLYTSVGSHYVKVQGQCSSASKYVADKDHFSLSYVRIA